MNKEKPRYTLEMFIEQGSEGAHWCIYDNSKSGYDGLIQLSEGMKINILGIWEGTIKRDTTSNRHWYEWCEEYLPTNDYRGMLERIGWNTKELSDARCKLYAWEYYSQQVAGGYYCHWLQEGVDADEWASWFINELEVEIIE
jgi:hypothetical protein